MANFALERLAERVYASCCARSPKRQNLKYNEEIPHA